MQLRFFYLFSFWKYYFGKIEIISQKHAKKVFVGIIFSLINKILLIKEKIIPTNTFLACFWEIISIFPK